MASPAPHLQVSEFLGVNADRAETVVFENKAFLDKLFSGDESVRVSAVPGQELRHARALAPPPPRRGPSPAPLSVPRHEPHHACPLGPTQAAVFTYEAPEKQNEDGEWVSSSGAPQLELGIREGRKVTGKVAYFVRGNPKGVGEKTVATELVSGVVDGEAIDVYRALVSELFVPVLGESSTWGKNTPQDTTDFLTHAGKFSSVLNEAVNSIHSGLDLAMPAPEYTNVELKPYAFTKAADDPELVGALESVLRGWCDSIQKLVDDETRSDGDNDGPDTELEYWRGRMAKLNSVIEQLKKREARVVLGVLMAARSKAYKQWKTIDVRITDVANEAKDNVKYLITLEKSLEPMYSGTPMNVIDAMPSLMNNVKMMHTIARYYNTPERMTTLLCKITNQLIVNCKRYIERGGKMWEQDMTQLLENLKITLRVRERYQEEYETTKHRAAAQARGGGVFAFDEAAIFRKFDLFCKRVLKLTNMFTTVKQFSSMSEHTHIEGLEAVIDRFKQIADDMKRKPYDLLDFTDSKFDRDLMDFDVQIHDLETQLQSFINSAFENISSTEQALNLLQQFQTILERDTLKGDLEEKYLFIFSTYGFDLEAVQTVYEKHKNNPPVPRNAPPIAGNIMWARQLLRRIEEPMRKFSTNKAIMASKEAKRVVRVYNRVAQTLIKFEMLWVNYFLAKIERDKAGLQATLLVRHPEEGRLLVNFDRDILQLMREAKYLQRMGIEVPESAKMVLLQEDKFKGYYNQLTHVLKEAEKIERAVPAVLRPLMQPHIVDLEQKVQPGLYVLTWTSMNIDAYLHRIHQSMTILDELVRKVSDILENRVEANVKKVARLKMVRLPSDQTVMIDDFKSQQVKMVRSRAHQLRIKNEEIQRALDDIVALLEGYPRENKSASIDQADISELRRIYARQTYEAVLTTTKSAFSKMKGRLASTGSVGFLFVDRPFFDVDVELSVPHIALNPSLEDIQGAINTTAKEVLAASQELVAWGPDFRPGSTFFERLASDREIVVSVLLLTGSVEHLKNEVNGYLALFDKFRFLWLMDMQAEYDKFMKSNPTLDAVEVELKKYDDYEQQIAAVSPVHNIGCLSIETSPLKTALRTLAADWKRKFSQNLHENAQKKLEAFMEYVNTSRKQLDGFNKKIDKLDLDDVRNVMMLLNEVREKEADIDTIITPIEDMYNLLNRFNVPVDKDEQDQVTDLNYSWEKLRQTAGDVSEKLTTLQSGYKKDLISQVRDFVVDVTNFRNKWETEGPMVDGLDPMDASNRLNQFRPQFEVKRTKWKRYEQGEQVFGLPVTVYPELEQTEKEIDMLVKLYGLYVEVVETTQRFGGTLWADFVDRLQEFSDTVTGFQNKVKKLPKALRDWPAYADCRQLVDDLMNQMPLLEALASKDIRPRHWESLQEICGKELNLAPEEFKLNDLLACNLLQFQEDLEDMTNGASKESNIERKLVATDDEWSGLELVFANYRSRGEIILSMAETSELIEKLEEAQMNLQGMATNRYSTPFRETVNEWIVKLSTVSEVIEQWLGVQNLWTSLEVVFEGGDIVKSLPQEAKRFKTIDAAFMKNIALAQELKGVIEVCAINEVMKTSLPGISEQLELCQKALSSYLEDKRAEFPRFYFVSDATLLQVLSVGSDPDKVQPHFQSGLFDAVAAMTFDKKDKSKIVEIHSRQKEVVPLEDPVDATGTIEVWLQRLVDGMKNTVKQIIKRSTRDVEVMGREEFIFGYPAQISLLGMQIQWTTQVQSALIAAKTKKDIMNSTQKKVASIMSEMINLTTNPELTPNQRTNLETVITVYVHQRDVTDELVKRRIRDPTDFEWLKQARFYWRSEADTVIISVTDAEFEYSYEYLGIKERLVVTPLTDICYITLSQALNMCLGGAPAGPAGTGKTETVKDLGNTLGKYVVVFNCGDQFDYIYMGKIYRGLAQSGLWGCFDEFNRINLDVLSVCAQQVLCVLTAIRENKKRFVFTDGKEVDLDKRVGYFITMNPGYAGRQELPENLKSLFRGVTMMVPDRSIIMQVKLAACGYQDNKILSKKFFVLYGLCEQQLSKQRHYDFGLRNILSVLRTAGASKRAYPEQTETFLIMRTLRDMNMSKFVAEDVPLFKSLIADLFLGIEADRAKFDDVDKALREVATEDGLQLHESWLNKCIQLYETYLVRHGIMLVGPTGAGKTAIATTLAGALSKVGRKHVLRRMNPKAITAYQMFGKLDNATQDWTDGIFSVLWRRATKDSKSFNTWIVLDGPVDAIWIENLNTVLDDNKVLTLSNGDRILMTPEMKAFFEPENLNNASPATVSRAGIIYVSDIELGWEPVAASWMDNREKALGRPQDKEQLAPLFSKYVNAMLNALKTSMRPIMTNQDVCLVQYLLDLLEAVLASPASENKALSAEDYERLFIYSLAWTLGATTTDKDRSMFEKKLQEAGAGAALPKPEDPEDTIFDFMVDPDTLQWTHWSTRVPEWKYPKGVERPEYASLVIPTLDSVRVQYVMQMMSTVSPSPGGEHAKGRAVLLVGEPGTAKSTIIQSWIRDLDPEKFTSKLITFSYLTKPGIFQSAVESSLEKNPGRIFRPAGGRQMVVFVDDISMPEVNEWGDQITNELVRQLLEEEGFYQLEKPIGDFKKVERLWYYAAMNTPGGGKNDIPNRLKRHFAIINVPLPSRAAINNIFGTLISGRFDADVFDQNTVDAAQKLVPMTINFWTSIQKKMLPTPAKFHYLWNVRELSKVFQGVILATTERFRKDPVKEVEPLGGGAITSAAGYLLNLWRHECYRVFVDKLVSYEDKEWAAKELDNLVNKPEFFGANSDEAHQLSEQVYFVDWLRPPVEDDETGEVLDAHPSFYEAVRGGMAEVRERVEQKQAEHNENSRAMKLELVYFDDALSHLMRITRLLALSRGNGLLVGVGGSGKQSLTRMSAYIAGAEIFQITITKTYNENNLFEDIRGLYKTAGLKGSKVCFLFTDSEVKKESFLEYINQVLMTGEVAGLFAKDEQLAIIADMRPIMKKLAPHIADTVDNLWSFFINRVRENLHVMLAFSPVGVKFARRAQQFPGLINGCTIDWFMPWPEEALVAVSGKFINDFEMACDETVKRELEYMMGNVHVRVTKACREYFERFRRHVYVTPKSYLSFMNGYKDLYSRKWDHVKKLAAAINTGLGKMKDAKEDVDKLKDDLKVMNKEVEVKSKQVKELLSVIAEKTTVAEKEKQKANAIAQAADKQAAEIGVQEAEANRDLAAAEPALQEAERAASSIDPNDVKKVMGIRPAPPSLVKRVFDCVLILQHKRVASPPQYEANDKVKTVSIAEGTVSGTVATDVNVASWDESMKLDPGKVPEAITSFLEQGYINDEVIELMYPYVRTEDFWPIIAKGVAGALEGICGWARAMVKYYNVAKVVEPKRDALRKAQNQLKGALKEKAAADATLAEVQGQVDELQRQFDQAMKEKQELEDQASMCERKMDAAANLIGALSGEETRWLGQSAEFDDTIQRLSGDCALASAFVSYLGPFNREFRELLLKKEFYRDCVDRNIPVTKDMNVTNFLVEDAEVGEWNLDGLPTDELSVQNGIMVTRASRFPVLVDPQGQGKEWIKNREGRNGLKTTTLSDRFFRNALEECMSDGKPLLIENIEEELDPVLDPVLEKRIIKKGRSMIIQLADKEVDFDDKFRIFFTTRLPAPHFSPELSAKVTVVDFTVTLEGLEDQLLGKLILKERAELEEQRKNLLVEVNDYKKKIKQLEDDLLDRLSSSQGNLLDDTELIEVLANTKKGSQEVNTKLQVASETNEKITEACEEFRPVAHRAALIYFLIAEFSSVNTMYQTSLFQFEALYSLGIDRSEKATMPSKRIKNIIDYLTYSVFLYIQRGLFERHKMIFALMLTNKILVSAGEIKEQEVNIFLKGGSELDINSVRVQKPAGKGRGGESWISDTVWLNLVALSEMRAFSDSSGTGTKGILDSVRQNEQLWNAWYDKEAPESSPIPEYSDHISKFERMCLVKSFREDRTLIAAEDYIADALGRRFVESVPLSMEKAWEESEPAIPLICILSRGADPTKLISDLARKKKKEVLGVSMGQGQEVIARGHMKTATEEGHWVLLQNTHLGIKYLSEVEELILKESEKFHPEFRLWITAEPTPEFPIGLLQMSIKITSEAPMGIKAGMRSSYQWVTQDMLEAVPRQEWRQLLYIMCYVHSIVQERRKFGPIGWNIPYEFNQSDVSACVQFLQNHLLEMETKKATQPTWETVRYMISVIMYGGRITDDFDQLLMDTYADRYFNQAALTVGYELFKDVKSDFAYVVPDSTEIEPFRAAVESFPSQDSPEAFGLHSNADLTFRTLQVSEVINTIIDTMPKSGGGSGGESREDKVDRLCADRLEKVPPMFEFYETRDRLKKLGETEPLTVHLKQEIDRLNIVLKLTVKTLKNLRLAIAGTIILSADLVEALDALYDGRVPPQWTAKSWESSGMGTWFTGLVQRYEQLRKWLDSGRPKSYWMTGFFNAQGFLTATLQEVTRLHAKKDKWTLDDVIMDSSCTGKKAETLGAPPAEGVYIHGLFLDGCAWSDKEGRLTDAEPKKVVNPLPVLHVTGNVKKSKEGSYACPCYKVKKRTALNFISKFDLRTEDAPSRWVLRGVALLCTTD